MSRIIINGQEVDLEAITKMTKEKAKGKTEESPIKERREVFPGASLEISDLQADITIG